MPRKNQCANFIKRSENSIIIFYSRASDIPLYGINSGLIHTGQKVLANTIGLKIARKFLQLHVESVHLHNTGGEAVQYFGVVFIFCLSIIFNSTEQGLTV